MIHLLGLVRDGHESLFPVLCRCGSQQLDVFLDLRLDGGFLLRNLSLVSVLEEALLPLRLDLFHLVNIFFAFFELVRGVCCHS